MLRAWSPWQCGHRTVFRLRPLLTAHPPPGQLEAKAIVTLTSRSLGLSLPPWTPHLWAGFILPTSKNHYLCSEHKMIGEIDAFLSSNQVEQSSVSPGQHAELYLTAVVCSGDSLRGWNQVEIQVWRGFPLLLKMGPWSIPEEWDRTQCVRSDSNLALLGPSAPPSAYSFSLEHSFFSSLPLT